jgi:hypothetical protein
MEFNPHTPLAGERLQPLGHLSEHNQKLQAGKYTRLRQGIKEVTGSKAGIWSALNDSLDHVPVALAAPSDPAF